MKSLVVGGGSIGRRHLQNLKVLGVDQLGLVEIDFHRRRSLSNECAAVEFADLDEGLDWLPDCVVLATPSHLHAEQALHILRRGFDLLVEKPLCHTLELLPQLADLATRTNLISLVGCNMRFHPGPAKVKELLTQHRIGKLLFARIHSGSYLPSWRPGTDYQSNYAAREETGGGCILDCIHEIDLACWYLGDVEEVYCFSGHLSSLDIATEDVAALICRHEDGVLSEIHLDYVQRTCERGCQIVGETGSIFWDFNAEQVRWYDSGTAGWSGFQPPENWQLNQMYLDEMQHFLDCIRNRKPSVLPIEEAAAVMKVAFAAKASARLGKPVSTGMEVLA